LKSLAKALVSRLQSRPAVADRLLVVEGDQALRDAYATHFSRSGFDVHCATTLAEAAALLGEAPFDAVIADVRGDAADAAPPTAVARCLDRSCGPPVVVLTAYGEPSWASEAARLGVDAFLHKPVSLVWLEQLVRSRIDQARLQASSFPAAR
jgi:DNA-binding response OmpR family regulator